MWSFRRKRGRELFRSYELAVIDALRSALPREAAELYDRQIERLELVQRLFEDKDVYTYPNRRGPQMHDPALAFPNRSLELKLATIKLRGATGTGEAVVLAVDGHALIYHFRPSPRRLGARDSIVVSKTTLHADPTQPEDGSTVRRRLNELAIHVRAEVEAIWAERPAWASQVVEPEGAYGIELEDGAYLVLAQLADTTYIVVGVDPPRPGVRRYDPSGELIGEFRTVQEAILGEPTDGSS
jgi:hypothetical protein